MKEVYDLLLRENGPCATGQSTAVLRQVTLTITAIELVDCGKKDKALEILAKCLPYDETLNIAKAVSKRSTCIRRQYGAVIVKNDEIIATGYNGSPRKELNCCDIMRVANQYTQNRMLLYQHQEKISCIMCERFIKNTELNLINKEVE